MPGRGVAVVVVGALVGVGGVYRRWLEEQGMYGCRGVDELESGFIRVHEPDGEYRDRWFGFRKTFPYLQTFSDHFPQTPRFRCNKRS